MNKIQNSAFRSEINAYKVWFDLRNFEEAFRHLERAHIIGQLYIFEHTYVHCLMLKIAIKQGNFKEIFGQLLRIPLGLIGSAIGVVPTGNTGGANVSAFSKMEIPPDIKKIL